MTILKSFEYFLNIETLKIYSIFLAINLVSIILVLRGCFFLFIARKDPLHIIIPQFNWFKKHLDSKSLATKLQKIS